MEGVTRSSCKASIRLLVELSAFTFMDICSISDVFFDGGALRPREACNTQLLSSLSVSPMLKALCFLQHHLTYCSSIALFTPSLNFSTPLKWVSGALGFEHCLSPKLHLPPTPSRQHLCALMPNVTSCSLSLLRKLSCCNVYNELAWQLGRRCYHKREKKNESERGTRSLEI